MKTKRTLVSIAVIFSLLIGSMTTAFAGVKSEDSDFGVYALNENKIIVKDTKNNVTSLIQTETTGYIETITVKNLSTGEEEGYFIRNNKDNTLYSSITGYTGSLSDATSTSGTSSKNSTLSTISPYGYKHGDLVSVGYSYSKISYKTLAAYVGIAAGAAAIVGAIVGLLGIAAAASLATLVNGILTVIQSGIALASSSKGVRLEIETKTFARVDIQGNVYFDIIEKQIVGITTY